MAGRQGGRRLRRATCIAEYVAGAQLKHKRCSLCVPIQHMLQIPHKMPVRVGMDLHTDGDLNSTRCACWPAIDAIQALGAQTSAPSGRHLARFAAPSSRIRWYVAYQAQRYESLAGTVLSGGDQPRQRALSWHNVRAQRPLLAAPPPRPQQAPTTDGTT